MDFLITVLSIVNFMLFIAWIVVGQAQRDRRYAARVRAEHDRKTIIRRRD
ncbi:MAG: hypothetical protein AAFQ54_08520 [Pseudomonadota bacterium]